MKLVVFGATGTVGVHLVQQALDAGHEVTAFVRAPSKLSVQNSRLSVIQGDVLRDDDRIAEAIAGQDTVLVALGAGAKGGVRAEGTRRIIQAMKQVGVRRLICQTTLGAGKSFGNLNWKWRFIFRVPLRWAMADHEQQERYVQESDLNWTIIRPASFTDGELTGEYQFGFPATLKKLTLAISRADVAQFMLRQLHSDNDGPQTLALSY